MTALARLRYRVLKIRLLCWVLRRVRKHWHQKLD
jgi:hypothetical protein